MNQFTALTAVSLCLLVLTACGGDPAPPEPTAAPSKPKRPTPPVPEQPALVAGYDIWRADCRNCHGIGRDGAPLIASREQWEPRLAKGREVLYQHAIEGWFAPSMAEMPARGGNKDLSDEQVQAAVDYMIWAALER